MIYVTDNITIRESELDFDFIRSSGPGGQNVNKVATAAQLRFNIKTSPSLPEDVRERLLEIAGKRVTEKGEIIIKAHRFRTQSRNREDAIDRLVVLIRKAAFKPKPYIKKKPSRISKLRRLEAKRQTSEKKRLRNFRLGDDY